MKPKVLWIEPVVDALLAHRAAALAICFVGTVAMALAASRLEFSTSPETILESSDADLVALRTHEEVFGGFEHAIVLVIRAEDVFAPETLSRLHRATDRVGAMEEVAGVRSLSRSGFPLPDPLSDPEAFRRAAGRNRLLTPFLVSSDARTACIVVDLKPEADAAKHRRASIDAVVAAARAGGLEPLVAGVPAVRLAYADFIRNDILLLPPLVGFLLALLLYLALRSVLPVLGLLAAVMLAAVWTVGLMSVTGGRITALTAILPALIMVVGIATGVHVVAQFREERENGADAKAAARAAILSMALPCGLTSLTTAVGFSSLVVAGIRDVREFGLYSAAGALLAFFLGVPFVGILLSLGAGGGGRSILFFAQPLRRLGQTVVRRPRLGIVLGVAVAAVAVLGLVRLESDTFLLEDIRPDIPVHRATRIVDEELGGVVGFDLVIETPSEGLGAGILRWIEEVESALVGLEGVRAVLGPGTLVAEARRVAGLGPDTPPTPVLTAIRARGGGAMVDAFVGLRGRLVRVMVRTGDVGSSRAERIREEALALCRRTAPAGVEVRVGGLTILAETVLSRLMTEMGKSLAVAFVVIFLLMSLLFRSPRVGALSMVPNFLPLLVAAGFMGFTGIKVRSSIALIFAVALGLAVDDTIHVLMRYMRERAAGRPVRSAVYLAIRWTGRPVMLTSLVLLVGFLAFATSGFKATAQFGVISAVTIAAALVGDLLLLPSLLLRRGSRRGAGAANL
ncbi:MAG: efflux RND transporter permease subunit [Planctomycetota bacterium]|jgi:predicted RND superfamily exporter protein